MYINIINYNYYVYNVNHRHKKLGNGISTYRLNNKEWQKINYSKRSRFLRRKVAAKNPKWMKVDKALNSDGCVINVSIYNFEFFYLFIKIRNDHFNLQIAHLSHQIMILFLNTVIRFYAISNS